MIKGITSEKVEEKSLYPYVGVGNNTRSKVLFVAPKTGYVLEDVETPVFKRKRGDWSDTWDEDCFIKINCTVEFN